MEAVENIDLRMEAFTMKIKNISKKILAAGMAGTLVAMCLAGCGTAETGTIKEESAEETAAYTPEEEAEKIVLAGAGLISGAAEEEGKDETVYVIADANGNPTDTIVSACLKNPDGAQYLKDEADLQDIVNVKGDETFTEDADGSITWDAEGKDIYYRGTTDRELPVSTSVSYQLNGKEVSAQEAAGQSGHLKITFNYTNNTAEEKEVNGETVTLCQPFMVMSGLLLDGKHAENVTVTNGKVISTGDKSVAVGMAMPGLKESLGLSEMKGLDGKAVDISIPETVEIEADVTDFELLTTVTVIENNLMKDLDLSNVESIDDLKDAIGRLTDAAGQLEEGTEALADGVSQLKSGSGELADGIAKVDDGTGELKKGADAAAAGAEQLSAGAKNAETGAKQLSAGAGQVNAGADALKQGSSDLKDGAEAAAEGAGKLAAGTGQLSAGAKDLSDNMNTFKDGLGDVKAGAESLENGILAMQTAGEDPPAGVD